VCTVWTTFHSLRNSSGSWAGSSITDCFKNWFSGRARQSTLPIFVCWYIWKDRNFAIFEDRKPSAYRVAIQVSIAVDSYATQVKAPVMRNRVTRDEVDGVVGWFDGAAEASGSNSGAGGIIRTRDNRIFKWILNCGPGSNTRAELLGAWALLTLASRLFITDIM
jgi:hypothetical protein